MSKIKAFLKSEFINGQTAFDWGFMIFGILLQVFAIVCGYLTGTPDNAASIISAITGVVSVVLCAQGKISFYVFGYIQLLTYTFGVAIPNHLYGEIWENVFYFVTMVYGTYIWIKNYNSPKDSQSSKIKPKKLNKALLIISNSIMVIGTIILGIILKKTNDPVPWFDALTTVPALTAQIFLMLGYREQWIGWVIEDITSIIMFIIIGNWVMVAQYIFWTINCIYGWVKWSNETNKSRSRE